MLANYHTHTQFCDGESTAEEMVISAIEKGFSALGFSGHGYTDFDLSYCMQDTDGYIKEIKRLKEKYKKHIQIYLGVEEDGNAPVKNRTDFDYIIGSSHYAPWKGEYLVIDSSPEHFLETFKVFDNDIVKLADAYYTPFCEYILRRKPDIAGHFDLITKYDDVFGLGIFEDKEYLNVSEKYLDIALGSDCIFEVNTGAIARKCRKTPYPYENLLHLMKKREGKIILNSDCHFCNGLDFKFSEMRKMLKDIGFQYVYVLYDNEFGKDWL